MTDLLDVRGLRIVARRDDREVELVCGVDLRLGPGEVLCLVGESGSGKSITMLAALGLLPDGVEVSAGEARLDGTDLLGLDRRELRAVRGSKVAMVFQDPMTALNPVKRVGTQVARAVRAHTRAGRRQAWTRALELLESVGIESAAGRARTYPHQWSGGMRQRAAIAMAIANGPDVLVADEPTTALDVTVQAQVMGVLEEARARTGAAMVMITHDLGLVAEVADRVAIMYAGSIVEQGTVWDLFDRPAHPYTRGLLGSLLTTDKLDAELIPVPGSPPPPDQRPAGCPFAPRCTSPDRSEACGTVRPRLEPAGDTHSVACHHPVLLPAPGEAR